MASTIFSALYFLTARFKTRFDLKAAAPESVAALILSSCPGSIQHIEVYLVMKVNSRRYQIPGS